VLQSGEKAMLTESFYWSRRIDVVSSVLRRFRFFPPTKEEVNVFARVCLSVCQQDYLKIPRMRIGAARRCSDAWF